MNDINYLVISVGSNFGDRFTNVSEALKKLQSLLENHKSSGIYETEAIGKSYGGTPYMNAVIAGEYPGDVNELNTRLKNYESECGRNEITRSAGNVPVDLDIVICNKDILRARDFESDYFKRGYKEILNS